MNSHIFLTITFLAMIQLALTTPLVELPATPISTVEGTLKSPLTTLEGLLPKVRLARSINSQLSSLQSAKPLSHKEGPLSQPHDDLDGSGTFLVGIGVPYAGIYPPGFGIYGR